MVGSLDDRFVLDERALLGNRTGVLGTKIGTTTGDFTRANPSFIDEGQSSTIVFYRAPGSTSDTISYTLGGSAVEGVDFTVSSSFASGTVTFRDGQDSASITIMSNVDFEPEPTETIVVSRSDFVPGTTVYIDDVSQPQETFGISVSPTSVVEGTAANAGGNEGDYSGYVSATVTVTRSDSDGFGIANVDFSGTATFNDDYFIVNGEGPGGTNGTGFPDGTSGTGAAFSSAVEEGPTGTTVFFRDGETSATFTIYVNPDDLIEGNETVVMTVDGGNLIPQSASALAVGGSSTETLTIIDDDQPTGGGGGSPDPTPVPTPQDDNLQGTERPDNVLLLAGNDTYLGLGGGDTIYGNQGDDTLFGGRGNDTVFGGQDDDVLFGGQDADILLGNLGNDTLFGNMGNDTLYGGQGNDTLYGGMDDDILSGDLGDDLLSGDLGADTYRFGPNSGADRVLGFDQASGDRLDLQGQTFTFGTAPNGSGNAYLILSGGGTVELVGLTQEQVNDGYFTA